MLLTDKIEVTLNSNNLKFYPNLNIKIGEKIFLNPDDVYTGSTFVVRAKCDICGLEKDLSFRGYSINVRKHNIYACSNKCAWVKNKKTNLEKYGNETYVNVEKMKITNLEKYGVENVNYSQEIIEKKKINSLLKYGFESPNSSEIVKDNKRKSCLEKFGVEYNWQSENTKNKIKKTNLERYGVEHCMQNEEIYIKTQISGFNLKHYLDTDVVYRGKYELDFLNKYYNKIEIKNSQKIKYTFENKQKIYYPDFYYPLLNLIIEIKSDYTYNKYLQKNLEKQKACLEQGYNFIFIINKDYKLFDCIIMK